MFLSLNLDKKASISPVSTSMAVRKNISNVQSPNTIRIGPEMPNDRPEPVANRPMTHTLMDDQIDWLTGRYSSHCQRLGEKTEFLQLCQSCRAAWISPSIHHYTPAVPDANVTGPCVILQHVE
jgi:hypothetical protein